MGGKRRCWQVVCHNWRGKIVFEAKIDMSASFSRVGNAQCRLRKNDLRQLQRSDPMSAQANGLGNLHHIKAQRVVPRRGLVGPPRSGLDVVSWTFPRAGLRPTLRAYEY